MKLYWFHKAGPKRIEDHVRPAFCAELFCCRRYRRMTSGLTANNFVRPGFQRKNESSPFDWLWIVFNLNNSLNKTINISMRLLLLKLWGVYFSSFLERRLLFVFNWNFRFLIFLKATFCSPVANCHHPAYITGLKSSAWRTGWVFYRNASLAGTRSSMHGIHSRFTDFERNLAPNQRPHLPSALAIGCLDSRL